MRHLRWEQVGILNGTQVLWGNFKFLGTNKSSGRGSPAICSGDCFKL
jgi:hypothetical protein